MKNVKLMTLFPVRFFPLLSPSSKFSVNSTKSPLDQAQIRDDEGERDDVNFECKTLHGELRTDEKKKLNSREKVSQLFFLPVVMSD